MCGIAGFIDYNFDLGIDNLANMTDTIISRGPDDSGHEIFNTNECRVGLGFRRLSIIDLSHNGHQPMYSLCRRYCIIFNGEVYNYQEIRKELSEKKYAFQSHTDTEVILNSFIEWGVECVNKFRGMFAFTIYDVNNQKIYLFRDRMGVKPLYYFKTKNFFSFGSELKVLMAIPQFEKKINLLALGNYFSNGYIEAPLTIFDNTKKLLPGHYIEYDLLANTHSVNKYWDISTFYSKEKLIISYRDAQERLIDQFRDAFKLRMVSDVPVGVFLSGGYDSSVITAILSKELNFKLDTFTIGFDNKSYNEANHAKLVAQHLGTNHHELYCTPNDSIGILNNIADLYSEPFADSSLIPTVLVSLLAKNNGVKVVLSADGGDELFAGYPRYFNAMRKINQLNKIPSFMSSFLDLGLKVLGPKLHLDDKLGKLYEFIQAKEVSHQYAIVGKAMSNRTIHKLLGTDASAEYNYIYSKEVMNIDLLNQILNYDMKTYLPDDILHKVDRATMSQSIEGREPLLDHKLIEFISQLPNEYKYDGITSKRILKDVVHRYIPLEIMHRPKMGFGIPIEDWLRKDLKYLLDDYLSEEILTKQSLFDTKYVLDFKDKFIKGESLVKERMTQFLYFQMWYKRWMS